MTNFKAQISNQFQMTKCQKFLSFGFFNTAQAALVPSCGASCTWCNLMQLFSNIVNFMLYLIFPVAATMIVIGGIYIMTAAGSPAKVSKGREIITAAIIGLLIALFSYLIIDTIIKIIAVGWQNVPGLGPWNQLKCP